MKLPLSGGDAELSVDSGAAELLVRDHRYVWRRYGVTWGIEHRPRHDWTYEHLVRFDVWRFGPLGFYRILLPR